VSIGITIRISTKTAVRWLQTSCTEATNKL